MELVEKLKQMGCDVESAMERFVGDASLYENCYKDALNDFAFTTLKKALQAGDTTLAFEASHNLKSIIGNLGLTPLYNLIVEIVEPLRRGEKVDLSAKIDKFSEVYQQYLDLINE